MPPKKSGKSKQADKKAADKKDEKKVKETTLPTLPEELEPTPAPEPPPAEPEPEPQPIPVPEPTPLPVPAPISRRHSDDVKESHESPEYFDHYNDGVPATGQHGWDSEGRHDGAWGDSGVEANTGGGGWETKSGWGEESEIRDDLDDYDDYEGVDNGSGFDNGSGWGPEDPAPHGQEQSSLPTHDPPVPHNPAHIPSPPIEPAAPSPPAQLPHDQSSVPQPSKLAPPQAQNQNTPPVAPKTYIFASEMANRNRRAAPPAAKPAPAKPAPQSNRPSYYWAPNQLPSSKQPPSTTKGQHNPALTNLSPWGEPKNVDPWGDPKPQPPPAPAPPMPVTQERKAWHDWGRQAQPARSAHPPKQQPVRMNDSYEYNSEDDEYGDDETFIGTDAWGRGFGNQHGWGPDPRKQNKVNHAPQGSDNGRGVGSQPVPSSAEHAQILNGLLNNLNQGHSGHHSRHPHRSSHPNSAYEIERAKRLQQLAEEKSRMQEMMYRQQHHYLQGKVTQKKHRDTGWDDGGWGAPKDEWTTGTGGWDDGGGDGSGWDAGDSRHGWDQGDDGDDDDWQQKGDGWNQSGHGRGDGGHNSWGNGGGGWGNGGGKPGKNGGGWDNEGGGWGNDGGGRGKDDGGWGNEGGGWGNEGGGWGNNSVGGHTGWDTEDNGWGKKGGNAGGKGHKHKGDGWDHNDNSWSNNKGVTNDWGENDGRDKNDGWGQDDGWQEEDDDWEEDDDGWGEPNRYHVVADAAQQKSSKTLMHAMGGSKPKPSKPGTTTASKLSLPPGVMNESDNKAFVPAMRAIFGRERMARDRIYWSYSPENEPQVIAIMTWIQAMESHVAFFGLLKFLETKERGALFVNVTYRLEEYPNLPAFDWLSYDQIQASTDRILQHSILASDPANQTLVFVYLPSRTGNSVAMWRRKLRVSQDVHQKHLQAIAKVKAGLRPDKEYRIHVDELPPQTKQRKSAKLSKSIMKEATKATAKSKPIKSAIKTHHRGQSLPIVSEEKKRKWWQILRFAT